MGLKALRKGEAKNLAIYYGALVAEGLIIGCLGPSLADLAGQCHTSLGGISLVLVVRPLGYLIGALACVFWFDRRDGHSLLSVASLACAGLLACVPWAGALPALSALILGIGFFVSLLDVGANTLLSQMLHERVGPFLNGLHFSFGLGAFVGPLLVGRALARQGHTAWAFWGIALLMLPLAFAFHRTPSPRTADARKAEPAAGPPADKGLLGLFVALFFLYGGIESGFGSWIFQYAINLHLAAAGQAALLSSLFWGLLGLGRLLGIPLLGRLSPQNLLTLLIPGALLSLGLLLGFTGSSAALWAGTAGMGLCLSCVFPTMLFLAGRRLSGDQRVSGRVTGTLFVGSSSGGMVLPWLMGQAFEPKGPRVAMSLAWVALLGLTMLFIFFGRQGRNEAQPII